jgi:hypothetical protein
MPFNIQLIVQYYRCGLEARQKELDTCLQKNLGNPYISAVHILTEEYIDFSHFKRQDKIRQTVIRERLSYDKAFHYANRQDNGGVWILANTDIYFDESLRFLKDVDMTKKLFALTRHDIQKDGNIKILPAVYAHGSQDAWIFQTPVSTEKIFGGFNLGIPACDSRIAYEFFKAGYRVVNPSKKIIIRHLDLTRDIDPAVRANEYSGMNTSGNIAAGKVAPPPYYFMYPTVSLEGITFMELSKIYWANAVSLVRRKTFAFRQKCCGKRVSQG